MAHCDRLVRLTSTVGQDPLAPIWGACPPGPVYRGQGHTGPKRRRRPTGGHGPGVRSGEADRAYGAGSRWTWKGAKLWLVGISSMMLTFTCGGWLVAHSIAAAMSSAVSGCTPL